LKHEGRPLLQWILSNLAEMLLTGLAAHPLVQHADSAALASNLLPQRLYGLSFHFKGRSDLSFNLRDDLASPLALNAH